MERRLFTYGYEGMAIDAFVDRLEASRIRTVVDVRANPLSRKRGFSKTAFSKALNERGISYVHLPAVGCPKPVRDRYKLDANWTAYTRGFLTYLSKQGDAVSEVARIALTESSCLVCFEEDFNRCHRTYVARAVAAKSGLKVAHIMKQTVILDETSRSAA